MCQDRYNFNYDGVIVSINTDFPYKERIEQRGKITYREKKTDIITPVNPRGELEKRTVLDDNAIKRQLRKEMTEMTKRINAYNGTGVTRQPRRRPGGEPSRQPSRRDRSRDRHSRPRDMEMEEMF